MATKSVQAVEDQIKKLQAKRQKLIQKQKALIQDGKLIYMDLMINDMNTNPEKKSSFLSSIDAYLAALDPKKDKKKIEALQELKASI